MPQQACPHLRVIGPLEEVQHSARDGEASSDVDLWNQSKA